MDERKALENEITDRIVGKKISRIWISYGSWTWMEIGDLHQGEYSPRGEFTLEFPGTWQFVDAAGNIVLHSESGRLSLLEEWIQVFVGYDVDSFSISEDLLSLQIGFTNGFTFRSQEAEAGFFSCFTTQGDRWSRTIEHAKILAE